jgi:acetylornithine deacetylase/succinyl-diaminopimelate desuccinylase-like protein
MPARSDDGSASGLDGLVRRALEAIDVVRLTETARTLIDVPSPTGAERRCAEALADRVATPALVVDVDVFDPERANVLARTGLGAGGIDVVLTGHLDTTGYGDARDRPWLLSHGRSDVAEATVSDGIVSGLGAYNMKGGIAAAAEALVALSAIGNDLPGSVSLVAVAGESEKAPVDALAASYRGVAVEGGGVGTRRYLARGPWPHAVIVCEPSGLATVNAQPGYVMLTVRVIGRAGYLPGASSPTVITAAGAIVGALTEWAAGYGERASLDCGLGSLHPTLTIGALQSGWPFKPGSTPAVAEIYADLRVPPHLEAEPIVAELTAVADTAVTAAGPFRAEVEVFARHLPGALVPPSHPLVGVVEAAVRQTAPGGQAPVPMDADFVPGDDGKLFAAQGIPYVKLGPGSPTDRHPGYGREQVSVAHLLWAARAYVVAAVSLATQPVSTTLAWPAPLTQVHEFPFTPGPVGSAMTAPAQIP